MGVCANGGRSTEVETPTAQLVQPGGRFGMPGARYLLRSVFSMPTYRPNKGRHENGQNYLVNKSMINGVARKWWTRSGATSWLGSCFFFVGGLGDLVLEVDGADHPECGVAPAAVVDHFNPAGDTRACSIPGRPALPAVELSLQRRPERLGHRVIKAHPGTPDGLGNAQAAADVPELLAGKLCPTVSVKHQAIRNLTA